MKQEKYCKVRPAWGLFFRPFLRIVAKSNEWQQTTVV